MQKILEKLRLIQENPGIYKSLTAEEQAELFLNLLTPKKKLLRKPVVITGIDGKTPEKDKDYLSKETSLSILNDIKDEVQKTLKAIKPEKGEKGKDAKITDEIIEKIITESVKRVPIPRFPYETIKIVNETQDALVNVTEDILDIKEDVEKLKKEPKVIYQGGGIGKKQVYGFINQAVKDGTIPTNSASTSFETVSKNLDATDATLNYTGENLTSIAYINGIIKTLNYTGDNLTSVVLSGATPSGIDLTKTLSYTGENLTGVLYS